MVDVAYVKANLGSGYGHARPPLINAEVAELANAPLVDLLA